MSQEDPRREAFIKELNDFADQSRAENFPDKLVPTWGATRIPDSMAGPVVVPSTEPQLDSYGPEWEQTKKIREDIGEVKKSFNDVAQLIKPVYEPRSAEAQAKAMQALLAKIDYLRGFADAALPRDGQFSERRELVKEVVETCPGVAGLSQDSYDDMQEMLRRHQQKLFGDMKNLLDVMKKQKAKFLADLKPQQ